MLDNLYIEDSLNEDNIAFACSQFLWLSPNSINSPLSGIGNDFDGWFCSLRSIWTSIMRLLLLITYYMAIKRNRLNNNFSCFFIVISLYF